MTARRWPTPAAASVFPYPCPLRTKVASSALSISLAVHLAINEMPKTDEVGIRESLATN